MWQTSSHTKSLELIAQEPRLIGLDERSAFDWIQVEYPFMSRRGKQIEGEVDVALHQMEGDRLYIVEFKCNDSKKQREKAKQQLLTAKQGLRREYGFRVDHMLYVHNKFVTEELQDTFEVVDNDEFVRFYEEMLKKCRGGYSDRRCLQP